MRKKEVLHPNRSHVNALCAQLHINDRIPDALIFDTETYDSLMFYIASLVGNKLLSPFDVYAEVVEKEGLYMPIKGLKIYQVVSKPLRKKLDVEALEKLPPPRGGGIVIGERRGNKNTKSGK